MAGKPADATDVVADLWRGQVDLGRQLLGSLTPPAIDAVHDPEEALRWADVAQRMQTLWLDYQNDQAQSATVSPKGFGDVTQIARMVEGWARQMPFADPARQLRLMQSGFSAWQSVLGHFGMWPAGSAASAPQAPPLRTDPRFADPLWRDQPFFALLHQGYLLMAEELTAMAISVDGLAPDAKEQLLFATKAIVDALSPANFPLTNPLAIERARQTRGESLVKGFENLLADLRRGQITQTNPTAFRIGENIANTPGKVLHEAPLYQIIQYTPTTDRVMRTPLIIFPAWINRFYILDLNPEKSFVRWAVAQGLTVFMVSWKSADETMADVRWDDYISAQIAAVDFVRDRLEVPAVHTIGYCVAGTTLAATLSVLAQHDEADKIASATFFTAQVDFEDPGELKHFANSQTMESIAQLSDTGYLDGRYMAAAFNLLRGNDLIWKYVGRNYLLGEEYQPFDLLHWNGDVTNLPANWHTNYMRDLYRDNRLVEPGSLSACGVPLDLGRIATPCYIQAGREDHIAPAGSVWKLTRHLKGPWTFQLAASGHIAGVVNPPSSGKYRYWTNDAPGDTLESFIDGADERPGSWWPHWYTWLRSLAPDDVSTDGPRTPGGEGDPVLEDAPGRYVKLR